MLWDLCGAYSVGSTALQLSREQEFTSASKLVEVLFKGSCDSDVGLSGVTAGPWVCIVRKSQVAIDTPHGNGVVLRAIRSGYKCQDSDSGHLSITCWTLETLLKWRMINA